MIDPFDAALSEFIDTLPRDAEAAQQLLAASAPFTGQGDLPALAELSTMLRAVPPYEPRPEWAAASKARLMSAPLLPPEKRGFTWLGSMFLPLTQLSLPALALPRLSPSPVFARAAVAFALILTLASVAHNRAGQNPILQVTTDQAPVHNAQQAIAAAQEEMVRLAQQSTVAGVELQGSPRDVVLLSKHIELAEEAIEKAPAADQPRLRSQLQGVIRAVRFDGVLEGITNGSTLQVSGVAVQADPAVVQQLKTGQSVSLLVTIGSGGKLQAVQVAPVPSAQPSSGPASPGTAPPNGSGGGTAPQTSQGNAGSVAGAQPAAASASNGPAAGTTGPADADQPAAAPARVTSNTITQRVRSDADDSPKAPSKASATAASAPAPSASEAPAASSDSGQISRAAGVTTTPSDSAKGKSADSAKDSSGGASSGTTGSTSAGDTGKSAASAGQAASPPPTSKGSDNGAAKGKTLQLRDTSAAAAPAADTGSGKKDDAGKKDDSGKKDSGKKK